MTISKDSADLPDATTIQDAFDLCLDDGLHYFLNIADFSNYREQAVLESRPAGGIVTLQAMEFDCNNRPTISYSGGDGNILELKTDHIVKGIKFDYSENTYGSADRRCIYVPTGFADYSEVSHCEFNLGNRYYTDGLGTEWGHIGYESESDVGTVKFYNNLVRKAGYFGVKFDPAIGNTVDIVWNTFVKCQKCVYIETMTTTATLNIYNNIFDVDASVGDSSNFYAIYVNDTNKAPTDLDTLDYNLYYFRNRAAAAGMWAYYALGGVEAYIDLSAIKTAYPTLEVNGDEADPDYCIYSSNYHLFTRSPALGMGTTFSGVTDDIDQNARLSPPSVGAYELSTICSCRPASVNYMYSPNDSGCAVIGTPIYLPNGEILSEWTIDPRSEGSRTYEVGEWIVVITSQTCDIDYPVIPPPDFSIYPSTFLSPSGTTTTSSSSTSSSSSSSSNSSSSSSS